MLPRGGSGFLKKEAGGIVLHHYRNKNDYKGVSNGMPTNQITEVKWKNS